MRLSVSGVHPSAVIELAWILDLLVQPARYAEPALDELDTSLLPGIADMRQPVKSRYARLWADAVPGCPELVLVASDGGCLGDLDIRRVASWLSTTPRTKTPRQRELLSEPSSLRRAIRHRLDRLDGDVRLRRAYRDLLIEVWELAAPVWSRRGLSVAVRAADDWKRRLRQVTDWAGVVRLMPPRHPLTRESEAASIRRRRHFSLTPLYFCMSGGEVRDIGHQVLVAVPASAREPIRRARDASYVASRMRLLAEPTRVHILVHLLSAEAGVMGIARALKMSQPTVSEHVSVLARAGLVKATRNGRRTVYSGSWSRLERIMEDARGTLARWQWRSDAV